MILERIISNMHSTQSMSGFLASEDAIEAAKTVVLEAVRRGPNLGNFLRGGSFASCVQVYRSLSSRFDADRYFFLNKKWNVQKKNPLYKTTDSRFPYPTGYCYKFQKTNSCALTDCQFKHKCSNCSAKTMVPRAAPVSALQGIADKMKLKIQPLKDFGSNVILLENNFLLLPKNAFAKAPLLSLPH